MKYLHLNTANICWLKRSKENIKSGYWITLVHYNLGKAKKLLIFVCIISMLFPFLNIRLLILNNTIYIIIDFYQNFQTLKWKDDPKCIKTWIYERSLFHKFQVCDTILYCAEHSPCNWILNMAASGDFTLWDQRSSITHFSLDLGKLVMCTL